jgi:hypothetical protein
MCASLVVLAVLMGRTAEFLMELEDDLSSSPIDLRLCSAGNRIAFEYLCLLREVLHVAGLQGLPVWSASLDLALSPLIAHVAGCPACNKD